MTKQVQIKSCTHTKPTCQCRRHRRLGFNPWVRKTPWRRKWQPTSLFLPRKSYGQRNLEGYSPWGHRVRHTRREQRPHMLRGAANTHTHTHTHTTQNSFKITRMMRTAEERSVQFSHSVMSDYSQCNGLQHTRFPCLSTTPWICSNSRPSSLWRIHHLTLCHALLLLPSIFPSISVFSNASM